MPPPKKKYNAFARPVYISLPLATFLGNASNEGKNTMSRIDVNRGINTYIKEKYLQNKEDRRQILPDITLTTLMNLYSEDATHLTYFHTSICINT